MRDRPGVMTRAELLAVAAAMWPAGLTIGGYLTDRAGIGIAPLGNAAASAVGTAMLVKVLRRESRPSSFDLVLLVAIIVVTAGYLFRLAWPALLPPGSGSDLTHHLLLVDYIERHGQLVHDPGAGIALGEMAEYTPGLHLLAVMAGGLARTDGFHAIYPVVALAVALKIGFVFLVLLRLVDDAPLRTPLAVSGVLLAGLASPFTFGSFTHDSFLAQALSELFALVLWWALIVWDQHPGGLAMVLFAISGMATVLTWPVWIGPPVLALVMLMLARRELAWRTRLRHLAIGLVPVALVATLHAIGRLRWMSIVGTSGAVPQPSPAIIGWWFPILAAAGFLLACTDRRYRSLVCFGVAIAAQSLALWVIAGTSGASTPYMAIKMTYLAIYPAVACVLLAVDWAWNAFSSRAALLKARRPIVVAGWLAVAALGGFVWRDLAAAPPTAPVVSNDLWAAGRWARDHLPATCVDYLVANEYTAYWLHLAVLGNARVSARTGDNDTFLTQPTMARWLVPGPPTYAIANLAVVPAEISRDVDVLQRFGSAAVLQRRGPSSCP